MPHISHNLNSALNINNKDFLKLLTPKIFEIKFRNLTDEIVANYLTIEYKQQQSDSPIFINYTTKEVKQFLSRIVENYPKMECLNHFEFCCPEFDFFFNRLNNNIKQYYDPTMLRKYLALPKNIKNKLHIKEIQSELKMQFSNKIVEYLIYLPKQHKDYIDSNLEFFEKLSKYGAWADYLIDAVYSTDPSKELFLNTIEDLFSIANQQSDENKDKIFEKLNSMVENDELKCFGGTNIRLDDIIELFTNFSVLYKVYKDIKKEFSTKIINEGDFKLNTRGDYILKPRYTTYNIDKVLSKHVEKDQNLKYRCNYDDRDDVYFLTARGEFYYQNNQYIRANNLNERYIKKNRIPEPYEIHLLAYLDNCLLKIDTKTIKKKDKIIDYFDERKINRAINKHIPKEINIKTEIENSLFNRIKDIFICLTNYMDMQTNNPNLSDIDKLNTAVTQTNIIYWETLKKILPQDKSIFQYIELDEETYSPTGKFFLKELICDIYLTIQYLLTDDSKKLFMSNIYPLIQDELSEQNDQSLRAISWELEIDLNFDNLNLKEIKDLINCALKKCSTLYPENNTLLLELIGSSQWQALSEKDKKKLLNFMLESPDTALLSAFEDDPEFIKTPESWHIYKTP